MEKRDYFKETLSDFAYDMACGGAIRHLSDLGYSIRQIMERLDFPASYSKVQKTVYGHLCDRGVLLCCEPEYKNMPQKVSYVREYNQYGKASFRRVSENGGDKSKTVSWKEKKYSEDVQGLLFAFLKQKISENGEEFSYVSCDFGEWTGKEKEVFQKLTDRQREYLEDIPWEQGRMYHRLNPCMQEILCGLYENHAYEGTCYFLKTEEKVHIGKIF